MVILEVTATSIQSNWTEIFSWEKLPLDFEWLNIFQATYHQVSVYSGSAFLVYDTVTGIVDPSDSGTCEYYKCHYRS